MLLINITDKAKKYILKTGDVITLELVHAPIC